MLIKIIEHYSSSLRINEPTKSKECSDLLNQTIFTLKFCLWNVSHILIFFIYCIILRPRTFLEHFFIFMFGVSWFASQMLLGSHNEYEGDISDCPHVVYENMLRPRFDDFIYNTLGQILYILFIPVFTLSFTSM